MIRAFRFHLIILLILINGITCFQQSIVPRASIPNDSQSYMSKKSWSPLKSTTLDSLETATKSVNEEIPAFNWFKAWYPVVPVEYLDPTKPHAFKLLGIDIVIWNDGPIDKSPLFGPRKMRVKGAKKTEGNWRVFVDSCPHRKVPLSEGRIEDDGSLFCSYHGWRFNGKGETIDVPQIRGTSELEAIRSNPKSNCNSFPVRLVDGLLWVWPESSGDSKIESALTDVPSMKLDNDVKKENVFTGTWNFRELPYGHDYFIENVVDPAHVGISHHNIVGDRYLDQTMAMDSDERMTKNGFKVDVKQNGSTSTTEFKAPSQVVIKTPFGDDGASNILELYSSPSRPGFSNHVGRIVIVKDKTGKMPKLLRQYTLPMPKWVNHILSSSFLNQDALFLHAQERNLAHNKQYRSSTPGMKDNYGDFTLPISVDKGVMKFRTWMRLMAGGHIPFKGDVTMPPKSNDVVFDVWNSHTKNCSHCLAALKNLETIRFLTFFASALVAVVRPKKIGVIGSIISSSLLFGVGGTLNKLIGMFYRYEFSHAENH